MKAIFGYGFLLSTLLSLNLLATQPPVTNHSFASPDVEVKHLSLALKVDFVSRTLSGRATLQIENKAKGSTLILDSRDLTIKSVTLGEKNEVPTQFVLGDKVEYLGQPLTINILPNTKVVNIDYVTHPGAAALQWLTPSQTAGKKLPFLFTQSQAVLARSWVPCQDKPSIRMTYDAKITVPKNMLAVMSAENTQTKNASGVYHFKMPQPIPSYLLALAVGDITFEPIDSRTGVYAEPTVVKAAAWEFADLGKMVSSAESLYGPYRWGRYDVLVLPPSFPFGGMENPRLTFLSPTVLAGDRSLVSLVAHELAHSWSGNLVTNGTWDDFWLNEGFTTYFELRIIEALYGKESADMKAMLGLHSLKETIADTSLLASDKQLHLNMKGRNPDDAVNDIAYEKGALFLRTIEQAVGRAKWDEFLKAYFNKHAFHSMKTSDFLTELDQNLFKSDLALKEQLQINTWINGPTLPSNTPKLESKGFAAVDNEIQKCGKGTPTNELSTKGWVTDQWIRFLNGLPRTLTHSQMVQLDGNFKFSDSGNSEISAAWLEHVIRNKYELAYPKLKAFMIRVGRRKYIKPLYTELAKTKEGAQMANEIYMIARPGYHPVAIETVDGILKWKPNTQVK